MRELDPRIIFSRKQMDCRVKSSNAPQGASVKT
jgi:hypothetical protein